VLAASITAAAITQVPYFSFSPGSAIATEPLVEVGEGGPTYESDGEILFLTVRIGRVTALEAFAGWVDPDVDMVPEGGVLQGLTDDENRARQAAAMVGAKNTALLVAFDRLGLPLDPTGTGAVVVEPPTPDSPADGVIDVADTIVSVDGEPILLTEDLGEAIGAYAPGSEVTIGVEPLEGDPEEITVTLAARPDDPTRGFLGVATDTRDFDPRPAFDVDIDPGAVGGPSAGLAFTLAMLDVLSEGDLTGGLDVAVTGSIAEDGTVLPVGGVAQKTVAAADAGADVLLVPAGEEELAQRSPHGLEVIGVATLDDALAALERLGGDPLPDAASDPAA
jgi:PDZ domain-containing protein